LRRFGRPARATGLGAAIALGVAASCAGALPSCGAPFESADTGIRRALARDEGPRALELAGRPGGTVELERVRFADVVTSVDDGRDGRAQVVAMVSAEGRVRWDSQVATLAYLGRERFHMRPCAARWCGEGDELDGLREVLAVLLRRHEQGAGAAPGEARRVLSWQIRVERSSAEVGEDLEVASAASGPGRRERRVHRLAREGGGWAFVGAM
jgi:hypothetical protein